MTNPSKRWARMLSHWLPVTSSAQGWQLSGLKGERAGAGPPAARAQWLTSGPLAGSGRGGQWAPASHCCHWMAGGKEGLLQPPEAPSLARDGRRPQTQRFPPPSFRIPTCASWGPRPPGSQPVLPAPGGQGVSVFPRNSRLPCLFCRGRPRCLLTVRGSMAALWGCVP